MMKKLILVIFALCFIGPASARIWTIKDDCQYMGGQFLSTVMVNNISVIPYKKSTGLNVLSLLEVSPVGEEEHNFLARIFYIQRPEILDIAYRAYSTSRLLDVCYKDFASVDSIVLGLRMRQD
ncbi:hypothetical protein [Bartonella sp. ML70XJBT.G]|uniref:hypothetical protein n=1 Tax=Bartonella sp. ML70XJBT.G TaxID=3019093 RepID=UPI0023614380|nr:hypothetical protein [Bartonella sp. ML70XJBT.G]